MPTFNDIFIILSNFKAHILSILTYFTLQIKLAQAMCTITFVNFTQQQK